MTYRRIRKAATRTYPSQQIDHVLAGRDLAPSFEREIIARWADYGPYEEKARKFLWEHKIKLQVTFLRRGVMPWDDNGDRRHIYHFHITDGSRGYSDEFGASMVDTRNEFMPGAYDILSCLQSDLEDRYEDIYQMAQCLGIETPSRAIETWEAIKRQTAGLRRVLTTEQLRQIDLIE